MIPDYNIFMMCQKINTYAFSSLNPNFYFRPCRKEELDLWKAFPFDNKEDQETYKDYMTQYFNNVYKEQEEIFFQQCLFVCDKNDTPIATAFVWKTFNKFNTLHWVKVKKGYEGLGIGRALLTEVLKDIDGPIYLHTQPSSYRAIKLYTDFGFEILKDEEIGHRKNEIDLALPYLKEQMTKESFNKLKFTYCDGTLSKEAKRYPYDAF